ncbi:Rho-related GTP-binding protein RhoV [Papilio machaon]|uniref:Rho-related GTP-binding protein RhoV n=1 Tax=Papilio machaon TaxID=76193 RepID=A0A0N1ICQ3_PAPMA|nr:Rho-related GTP-binding protein RhoV [Papilio machaon]
MSELRALCYPGTDVLMLCFSVVRPETFRSVAERWTRAVASVNAPLVLVGTQSDLATDDKVIQGLKVGRNQISVSFTLAILGNRQLITNRMAFESPSNQLKSQ